MQLQEYLGLVVRGGYLQAGSPAHELMHEAAAQAQQITAKINAGYHTQAELFALMQQLTGGNVGERFSLFPPIYSDFGKNLHIGRGVFINSGCCFQDQGGIFIGDGCLIGHQAVFATLNHALDPLSRGDMTPAPIRLGKNVWVGSHATILPGVPVGDGAVIAAGAVVTKDLPARTVAGGVPAKVIKVIE